MSWVTVGYDIHPRDINGEFYIPNYCVHEVNPGAQLCSTGDVVKQAHMAMKRHGTTDHRCITVHSSKATYRHPISRAM